MEDLWIGAPLPNCLIQNDLIDIVNKFYNDIGEIVKIVLDIKDSLMKINKEGSWSGEIYNKLVDYWNENTSVAIYNILNAYYKKYLASIKVITNTYSGLQYDTAMNDIVLLDESVEELEPIKTPVENGDGVLNFVYNHVRGFLATTNSSLNHIQKIMDGLNSFIEESLQDKSSSLDIYSEKIREANITLAKNIISQLQAFYNELEAKVNLVKDTEEIQMEDINKMK